MIEDYSSSDYDDDYITCKRTYATLCIYLPTRSDPNTITSELGMVPSRIQTKGEIREGKTKNWPTAWFLTTDGKIQSNDCREHIDRLCKVLNGKEEILQNVQREGGSVVISCYWLSSFGHGGPMLTSKIMRRLGELEIELWFDVYFDD